MLLWMKLKNLALVDEAEIDFSPGYNVISGETGAGKSVIMGGLAMLLGARADKSAIRVGTDKCEITASFQLPSYAFERVVAVLTNAGIEMEGDTLLIRRVISSSSTKNYINSVPVSLPVLKALGELLIDIHAANENQSLLKQTEQLRMLDRYAMLSPDIQLVEQAYAAYREALERQETFLQNMPSEEEASDMRADLNLIEKVNPEVGEDEILKKRHAIAANARSVVEIISAVSSGLTESEDSVFDRIAELRRVLNTLSRYDSENGEKFLTQLDMISETITALSSEIMDLASDVELDEGEFAAMEDRMRVLQNLKRRFGPEIEDILENREVLKQKLNVFDNAEEERQKLAAKTNEKRRIFLDFCAALSEKRKIVAGELVKTLTAETKKLGFVQAVFDICFSKSEPGPNGCDKIEIYFSANPGVPLKPLREVASSGEISRVMLAAKTVLAEADEIPVLVFDEIDANIGGETALQVGKEISKLGRNKQVICISHLPQTVRLADRHFLVSKVTDGSVTRSQICELDAEGRVNELTRMLGGGTAARNHAKALLNNNSIDKK